MEIIPAIDLIDGKCVRLSEGDYSRKTIYQEDPLEVALRLQGSGIRRLHLVDLDGAGGMSLRNLPVLTRIAAKTSLVIDFGGGIKTTQSVRRVLQAGAEMVNVGSVLVKDPELFAQWITEFGPGKFLPGADVQDKKVRIHGWKENTGLDLIPFIGNLMDQGMGTIFCTDISKDGMMEGPSLDLYREILEYYPFLHLVASGGVSSLADLVALKEAGCAGAIVGKALYEGKITVDQLEKFVIES